MSMKGYSDKITRQFNFNKWKIKSNSNDSHTQMKLSLKKPGLGYSMIYKKRQRNKKDWNLSKIQTKNFPQDFFAQKESMSEQKSAYQIRQTRRNMRDWDRKKPSTSQSQSISSLRFQKKSSLRSEQKVKPTSERKHRHVSFQVEKSRKKKPYQFNPVSQSANGLDYFSDFFKTRSESHTPMTPNARNLYQKRLQFPSISLQRS